MVRQYLAQFQQFEQAHPTPELRRENRSIARTEHDSRHPPPPHVNTGAPSQHQASAYPSPAYQSPRSRAGALQTTASGYGTITSAPRVPAQSSLPSLTTNEAQVQQLGAALGREYQRQENQPSASPSTLNIQYWQPPNELNARSKEANKTSPSLPGHLVSSATTASPRKRKATGPHQAAPPPSSAPKFNTSPLSVASNVSAQRDHGAENKGEILVRDHPFAPATGGRQQMHREGSSIGGSESVSAPSSIHNSTKLRAEENHRRGPSPAPRLEHGSKKA